MWAILWFCWYDRILQWDPRTDREIGEEIDAGRLER